MLPQFTQQERALRPFFVACDFLSTGTKALSAPRTVLGLEPFERASPASTLHDQRDAHAIAEFESCQEIVASNEALYRTGNVVTRHLIPDKPGLPRPRDRPFLKHNARRMARVRQ
ncbi:hypothetical protein VVD49_15730 [Uliginosibacterium sp. H3]|uniref:Uncharacterized protein n=1 Tax=Uliginosibacterium silvisoli TaxID=3114758 RepID=A0ABU6K6G1_9RHOO|nr:hypothetical protein [Uliginosibacterium sp. H3]